MLDNLALDLTDSNVRANMYKDNTDVTQTNASKTTLGYLFGYTNPRDPESTGSDKNYPTSQVSTTWNNINDQTATNTYSYSDPRIRTDYKNTKGDADKQWGLGMHKYGIYYNYCAASAGSYCYGNGTDYGTSTGSATEDICPANWHMPTGGASGDFQSLCTTLNNGTGCTNGMAMEAATNPNSIQAKLSLPLSGYVRSGSVYDQGSYGSWWSYSRSNSYSMYYLDVNASTVSPQNYHYRHIGFTMRCVANS